MIDKLKNITWLAGAVFLICVFINKLIGYEPRITNLEDRMLTCENNRKEDRLKISTFEIKLDTLLIKTDEYGKDIKDIYHLIMEMHK